jgi:hypothetical protein
MAFNPDRLNYEDTLLSKWSDEILDIIEKYNDLTTSDLQGIIEATVSNIYHQGKKDAIVEFKKI